MKSKVFLSSTIYDFSDLRSSIKYYLENIGFDVVASEFNDFNGKIEDHSYKACISAIESCQYFILLVGRRVGGEYLPGISITRQEYRHAYTLAQLGQIKILSFVRSEIITALTERNDLIKFLENETIIDQEGKAKSAPSRMLNDAEQIKSFIDEIRRVHEARNPNTIAERPVNNWIFQFSGFNDIVETLVVQLGIKTDIQTAYLGQRAEEELTQNLSQLLDKRKESVGSHMDRFYNANTKYKVSPLAEMQMERVDIARLVMAMMLIAPTCRNLKTAKIKDYINIESHFTYDSNSKRFHKPQWVQYAENLVSNIETLTSMASQFNLTKTTERFLADMQNGKGTATVKGEEVWEIIVIPNIYENVLEGSRLLICHIRGLRTITNDIFPNIMASLDMNNPLFRNTDNLRSVEDYINIPLANQSLHQSP